VYKRQDLAYVQRRNKISATGDGYKMGSPIHGVEYYPKETELWGIIWDKLYPKLMEHGCTEYKQRFSRLVDEGFFHRNKIPQLQDLNQFLNKETNWRIKPVSGILNQRDFLNCLAFRIFCCTQYIRHYSRPEYSAYPDIVHEFMGHIPMFADPKLCEVTQLIGKLSLGATDEQITTLGSIYYHTIEFGVTIENGKRKFFGAGFAGSCLELDNLVKCKNLRELDLINSTLPNEIIHQDL
jgi:phenylalanine-4-hydroxylase